MDTRSRETWDVLGPNNCIILFSILYLKYSLLSVDVSMINVYRCVDYFIFVFLNKLWLLYSFRWHNKLVLEPRWNDYSLIWCDIKIVSVSWRDVNWLNGICFKVEIFGKCPKFLISKYSFLKRILYKIFLSWYSFIILDFLIE